MGDPLELLFFLCTPSVTDHKWALLRVIFASIRLAPKLRYYRHATRNRDHFCGGPGHILLRKDMIDDLST